MLLLVCLVLCNILFGGLVSPIYPFLGQCFMTVAVILTFQFLNFNILTFYFNVHNFIFHLIFISIHIHHGNFFFLFIYLIIHLIHFRSTGCRANKSQGQVQQSHSVPLVFKFYDLILIYFRANFMEIFLNIFIWFWFL